MRSGPSPPWGSTDAVQRPRLLDQVRTTIRARRYSIRTEVAYVGWVRRYILFHGKKHPREMREPEVNRFLTHLALEGAGQRLDPEPGAERSIVPLPEGAEPAFGVA
jgi:hypothetical protein